MYCIVCGEFGTYPNLVSLTYPIFQRFFDWESEIELIGKLEGPLLLTPVWGNVSKCESSVYGPSGTVVQDNLPFDQGGHNFEPLPSCCL